MIERIYRIKCMVICDYCGTGQECDSWVDAIEFMREEGWKKRLVDGESYLPGTSVEIKEP